MTPRKFPSPAPPYVGPAAHTTAGNNRPIRRVVIHETQSPTRAGAARATAAYFRSSSSGGSAHYCVDPDEVVQVVYDGVIAWHAPPNGGSIGIELCGYSSTDLLRWFRPGKGPRTHSGKRNPLRWLTPAKRRTLQRAAKLTAQLLLAEGLPVEFRTAEQLRQPGTAGEGVTTHAEVSKAFRQSVHWDPGAWPRRRFMRQVRLEAAQLRAERR